MAVSFITCRKCGRIFKYEDKPEHTGYPSFGCLVGGDPEWEKDCTHCHTCLYDDCLVYLNKPQWWCDGCCRSTE